MAEQWLLTDDDLRVALAKVGWDWDVVKRSAEGAAFQVVYEAQLRKVVQVMEKEKLEFYPYGLGADTALDIWGPQLRMEAGL